MTEYDLFKGILSDVALYQNNKSQYLTYIFDYVLQHDYRYVKHMPLRWLSFPETQRIMTRPLNASTLVEKKNS